MTPEDIKQYCPKAENITIFPDGSIGMKVGDFAQSINVGYTKNTDSAQRQIKDLYLDLLAMDRSQTKQIQQAKQEAKTWKRP